MAEVILAAERPTRRRFRRQLLVGAAAVVLVFLTAEALLRLVLNSPPRTLTLSFASKRVAIERSVHPLWIPAVSRLCWGLPKPVAR